MLKYLIIQLDDSAASFCHYESKKSSKLIGLDDLKAGILFGMKENLMIQFVYPDYELPSEYKAAVETIDHSKIMSSQAADAKSADVIVFNNWNDFKNADFSIDNQPAYVLRTDKKDLFANGDNLIPYINKVKRLNIVITDVETFTNKDFDIYKTLFGKWITGIKDIYAKGLTPQLNLLTDRMMLDKMNNCNAGVENVTLAPNGKFYICPAFYHEDENNDCGNLETGLLVKNKQLLQLDHAPLCRKCDAFQCKRCVWLNCKTTLDANTPSHEQCVVAHLERNASRELLAEIRKIGEFLPDKEIKEIDYLDPFDVRKEI